MKTLQILQFTALAALLCALCLLALWLHEVMAPGDNSGIHFGIAAGILLMIAAALLIAAVYYGRQQAQIQAFLIRESREEKSSAPWTEEDVERLNQLRIRSDLSALQYQINPHFLYNTLDNIRSQALIHGQKDIAMMTEKLSRFFRYAISNRENLVRLEEETAHIDDYYYIQKQRFGDRFDMKILMEDAALGQCYVPKLVLQPLVENAIVHGLERSKNGGIVTIHIIRVSDKIVIEIADNGVGMQESTLNSLNERLRSGQYRLPTHRGRGTGIAVQNVNARIRLTFGEEFGIHYRSLEGEGTRAVVTLPYVDQFGRTQYEERME